ncbi:MAG: VOC family protein [Leptolyngbyaceae cyanobacterium SL_5_14]|nr:VOC family protein [Leptolyngbyaceae cyanobacterium SL_5_14]
MKRMTIRRSLPKNATVPHFLKKLVWTKFTLILSLMAIIISIAGQDLVYAQRSEAETVEVSAFQLHHVTLSVSNAERVSQWYVEMLGFTVSDRFTLTRPNGSLVQVVRVEIPGLQMNISEFEGSVSPNRTVDEQGWRHLAFQVDNVDQTYQRLQAEGVEFLTEPFTYDPPGYRIAFFRDPEGNILELYQDL